MLLQPELTTTLLSGFICGELMFSKDQKGYVMSGLGFLLLIPVMMIIPTFLAVESQSSDLPTKMVASDTSFRTFQDIKTDIRNQIFTFGSKIDNQTFTYNQSGQINSAINILYASSTQPKYQSVYGSSDGPIQISLMPQTSGISAWDYTGGTVWLNNGLVLTFFNTSGVYKDAANGNWFCNYTVKTGTNMTISITNGPNSGHIQPYTEFLSYDFVIDTQNSEATNTTAINSLNSFFQSIKSAIPTSYYS